MSKVYRMKKLFNHSGKIFIVALDHGFTIGAVPGIDHLRQDLKEIVMAGPDAIIIHKGLIRYLDFSLCVEKNVSIIIHLMGSTNKGMTSNEKRVVCSVEEALKLGADAVSVHVNIGTNAENDMIENVAKISEECNRWQLPLLGMFYPRGEDGNDSTDSDYIAHAVRIGIELNCDIVKTSISDTCDLKKITGQSDCPIIAAGGGRVDDYETLEKIKFAMDGGCSGVAVGRNVFQNSNRAKIIKAISMVVHEDSSIEDALNFVGLGGGTID